MFLKKLELPYDPAIPLLGTYLGKMKTLIQKGTCTPMFTAALCTIAKTWKQPECQLTEKWIKNKIMPFASTWKDLEMIILSEVSQTKTNII